MIASPFFGNFVDFTYDHGFMAKGKKCRPSAHSKILGITSGGFTFLQIYVMWYYCLD